MIKNLLIAGHDVVQWTLHIALIPVLAILKGADTMLQHLITELSRV